MELNEIKLTDVESAWLAAAIDGEGTITFFMTTDQHTDKPKIQPHISIYNTSVPFLKKAKNIIGYGNVYIHPEKNCHEYRINSGNICCQILKFIFPHLVIKRFQARKMIQFCERPAGKYTLKDLHIYEAVKRANYRGNAPLLESNAYNELKIQLESGGD